MSVATFLKNGIMLLVAHFATLLNEKMSNEWQMKMSNDFIMLDVVCIITVQKINGQ